MKPSILVVDDERNTREGLKKFLQPKGYEVFLASEGEEALRIVSEESPDIVLTDLRLPGLDGIELLERVQKIEPNSSVIVFTAYGSVDSAVEAMKRGAYHYLSKPVNLDELEALLGRVVEGRKLAEENLELKRRLSERSDFHEIVVQSGAMKQVMKVARQVASSTASVLIQGESGTGKELIARFLHEQSPRRENSFVAVHCAALQDTLLASELFGHEKGAFTGATERKIGRFERAHTGTLFLDEVGEIKEELQVKLLRVLQNGEFERVGGTKTLKTDVRLICATNRNLQEEVKKGNFREDLYYRINVILIEVPPLRERKEDIEPLVKGFVQDYAQQNHKIFRGVSPEAMRALLDYQWPGNVRELKNIVERMVVLASGERLELEDAPKDIVEGWDNSGRMAGRLPVTASKIKDLERELVESKLQELQGNKSKAAKLLGISRRTLYRKLKEYGSQKLR